MSTISPASPAQSQPAINSQQPKPAAQPKTATSAAPQDTANLSSAAKAQPTLAKAASGGDPDHDGH